MGTVVCPENRWYVRELVSACSLFAPRVARASGLVAALAACLALSACGGGQRQDASEPSGIYRVQVLNASFPSAQRLAQRSTMTITVKNVSAKPLPNLAVTVCNVTCTYPAPAGQGSSSAAFAQDIGQTNLANPSRPIWIVDRPPGACKGRAGFSCLGGGAGGNASAYSNTWVYGRLSPGATATFDWGVTAVTTGRYTVAWVIAAGLNGKARAIAQGGGRPQGTFTVRITGRPAQSYVNNAGQIVTTR
jgi:hypothetical protein